VRIVPNSSVHYESSGPVGSLSPGRNPARRWPKRRQWYDRIARDTGLTDGCKAWLFLIGSRSDDNAKPVWGAQARQAVDLGRASRSVRRYRAEAEAAGYITAYRARAERGPDGRWCRRKTNLYYLTLPPAGAQTAPRRRQRAPYCVTTTHKARPHLADTDGRSTPYGVVEPAHRPVVEARGDGPGPRTTTVTDAIAAARANLRTVMRR
jgi:hypothetical protein